MALFWENIKGFNKTNDTTYYTWIHFAPTSTAVEQSNTPTIELTMDNVYNPNKSLGHILTDGVNTSISKLWTFTTAPLCQGLKIQDSQKKEDHALITATYNTTSALRTVYFSGAGSFIWYKDSDTSNPYLELTNSGTTIYKPTTINNTLKVNNATTIEGKCTAQYFNTTSDRRSKTNITPVTQSMLDLINRMNVYTFNYIDNLQQRNLGVIAQELEDINIDGFQLVDQDGLFLTVKETKLIYVLLGAVKELSKEVKELKAKFGE